MSGCGLVDGNFWDCRAGNLRFLGCSPRYVYDLLRRLDALGTLVPAPPRPRAGMRNRARIVAAALAHPLLGPRKLALVLSKGPEPVAVSASTVGNVLRDAGLGTRRGRIDAAGRPDPAATV